MHKPQRGISIIIAALLCASFCFGQAGRAELFGTIHDPSGLAVPKAKIEAEDQAHDGPVFRYFR